MKIKEKNWKSYYTEADLKGFKFYPLGIVGRLRAIANIWREHKMVFVSILIYVLSYFDFLVHASKLGYDIDFNGYMLYILQEGGLWYLAFCITLYPICMAVPAVFKSISILLNAFKMGYTVEVLEQSGIRYKTSQHDHNETVGRVYYVLYVKDVHTGYKSHVFVSKYLYNKAKKGQILHLIK